MSRERLPLGPCATVNQQQPWMRMANHMLSRHSRVDKQQQLLEGMCGIRSSELKRKFQGKLAYHAYLTSPTFFKEIQVSTNIRV